MPVIVESIMDESSYKDMKDMLAATPSNPKKEES
jgi:hypothetical protein